MPRHLRVEADGGSRGNPGVAGYGALVRDEDGTLLAERAAPLGKASNNVAEYQGMIAGLTAAIAIDPAAEITVAMDSKLVVEQMSGRWKIKHEDMRRLALAARDLVSEVTSAGGRVRFEWIPRERNSQADKLSNDGMDGITVDRDHDRDGARSGNFPDADPGPAAPPDADLAGDLGARWRAVDPEAEGRGDAGNTLSGSTEPRAAGTDDAQGGARPGFVGAGSAGTARVGDKGADPGAGVPESIGPGPAADDGGAQRVTGVPDSTSTGQPTRLVLIASGGRGATRSAELTRALCRPSAVIVGADSGADSVAVPGAVALAADLGVAARAEPRWADAATAAAAYADLVASGGEHVLVLPVAVLHAVLAGVLGTDIEHARRLALAPGSLTGIEAWPDGPASIAFVNRT